MLGKHIIPCAVLFSIGIAQESCAQTSLAELLDSQRKTLETMEQFSSGPAFSSNGVFGMLADFKAARDQAVTGQVEKLDAVVREVLDLIESDKNRAKILALTIIWVPVGGEKETDTIMSKHYDDLREALLSSIEGCNRP